MKAGGFGGVQQVDWREIAITLIEGSCALSPVAVEKLDISEIETNLGDRKCPNESRRSFVGHPDAIYFLRISRSEFFNSHACL
jgi:hypothetical protein